MFAAYSTSRIEYIGKYHGRPQEHIVFTDHSFIDRNIVLHFYIISQNYLRRHHYILPDITVVTNYATRHKMTEMPDFSSISYLAALINYSSRMCKKIHQVKFFVETLRISTSQP